MSSTTFRDYQRSVQGLGVERASQRRDADMAAHLDAIRAKLNADEQVVFDRGVERMRQTLGGLSRVAALSVDDAVDHLRREMRSSPLTHRDGDPA